jgi:hypothetical protein
VSSKQNKTKVELPVQATKSYGFLAVVTGRPDDRGNVIARNGIRWADRRRAV